MSEAASTPFGAAPAVSVVGLHRSFGTVHALDGATLSIGRGEIYGLLGPNGAGKTTLIRSLIGLVTPERGTVTVLGQRMPDRAVLAQVGYMPQSPALYGDLTVEENLRFFAAVHDLFGEPARRGVGEALELVALTERCRSVVATLSGGMRQRVSLACAVVHRPRLLLLDEPTVGVDPQLRVELWQSFQRMAGEGTTLIVSSHVMDEAERCGRLGLLRFGRVLAEGTAQELRRRAGVERLEDAFLALSEDPA
ncbi:MAG TPA: ABC transporter ATP-binding protein [Candidatus Binatia bacterium]|nr:ABC transporter ATP-binding protein [Candidatus Binatia bacterium]